MVESNALIPNLQFGFRQRHSIIEKTKDKWSSWKQAILFCSIFRHFSSIQQITTLCAHIQVKTFSPSEWFPYPKILFALQTFPHKGWNWVHRTLSSQIWQCPSTIIISAIHLRPANLTRVYHSKVCRWYCSTIQRQWFSHCFTETANQPSCNLKLF
jgi:hypothetical protein